jgi:hypothetical protein
MPTSSLADASAANDAYHALEAPAPAPAPAPQLKAQSSKLKAQSSNVGLANHHSAMFQKLFKRSAIPSNSEAEPLALVFASTVALEQALDGSEEAFRRYYFALYHCLPDEGNDLNARRVSVQRQYPDKSVKVGNRFVLVGEAAFQVVSVYYQALRLHGSPDAFREHASRRHEDILRKHRASQSLPVPIDLTEGQLCVDPDLDFYACLALSNGQVFLRSDQ